jgi:hypothetical protein
MLDLAYIARLDYLAEARRRKELGAEREHPRPASEQGDGGEARGWMAKVSGLFASGESPLHRVKKR